MSSRIKLVTIALMFSWSVAAWAQQDYFSNWPAGRSPQEVGKRLAGGRTLIISRQGSGIYVQKVLLNGATYSSSWLPVEKLRPALLGLTSL